MLTTAINDPDPLFLRAGNSDLYWSADQGRVLGFLASPGHSGQSSLPLSESWADAGGVYFFLGAIYPAGADDAAFASALRNLLSWSGWPALGQKFVWLDQAAPQPFGMSANTLDVITTDGAMALRRGGTFDFNGYLLGCSSGMRIALASGGQTAGFAFDGGCVFTTPGGPYPACDKQLLLPMIGPHAGSLCFRITLATGGVGGDFDQMGAGLRYAYPAASDATLATDAADANNDAAFLHLPVLIQPTPPLTLHASLDPLRVWDPARSRLAFFAATADPGPGPMLSNFATARGHDVLLNPCFDGTRPAALVFAIQPLLIGKPGTVPFCSYLTLDGDFAISTNTPLAVLAADRAALAPGDIQIERLVCGASGLEYLGIPVAGEYRLSFMPGLPAFAPAQISATAEDPILTPLATTAWVYPRPPAGLSLDYYAQPDQATLYQASAAAYLSFFEMPAATLPLPDGLRAFPVAPYRGLDAATATTALTLERSVLAPERRRAITEIVSPPSAALGKLALLKVDADQVGVTPQGIAVGINQQSKQWSWLGIGNMADVAAQPDLRFTRIQDRFKQAMQTNRLFMVLANDGLLMQSGSIAYLLTPQAIADIRANQSVALAVLEPVAAAMTNQPYETEQLFAAALVGAAADITPDDILVFERAAGQLNVVIDGWRFQISPRNWHNPSRDQRKNAFLIFKLAAGRSLASLVADPSAWTWPEVAAIGPKISATQLELGSIIDDARANYQRAKAAGQASPYAHFIERIVDDENWCGILSLSCDVPLDTLPEPLQVLAAGIDPTHFYAHHVGFDLTPFEVAAGTLQFKPSASFGLIDYNNPADLYFDTNTDFAFKVLRLTIGFKNARISSFSSQIELLVNQLFGAPARLYPTERGNNLVLEGSYQRQLGSDGKTHGTYLFHLAGPGTFQLDSSALASVEVLAARLVTTQAADPANPAQPVRGAFQLAGNMRFWQAPAFDPFTFGAEKPLPEVADDAGVTTMKEIFPGVFVPAVADARADSAGHMPGVTSAPQDGYLRFDNLAVEMNFVPAVRIPSFQLRTDKIAFDLDNSLARPNSLGNRFPARLSGLLSAPNLAPSGQPPTGQDPSDLGYISVSCGLQQSKLVNPWYGIEYDLKLGTLGALAAGAGLSLKVLAAWSSGGSDDAPAIYVGVRLPGLKDGIGIEMPLQQVLKLGFRSIEFHTYPAQPHDPSQLAYLMRFRNFGLQVLGFSFPAGQNDIYLFGNPDQTSSDALGWYAAYSADEDTKKKKLPTAKQRRLAGRRGGPP